MSAPLPFLEGAELATVIMDAIEQNLDRWDQGGWRTDRGTDADTYCAAPTTAIEAFVDDPFNPACTTSFCYAGWVGAYDGVKWAQGSTDTIGDPDLCDCGTRCCGNWQHQITVGQYAQRRLGIRPYEADALFDAHNTLEALQAGVLAIGLGTDVADAVREVRSDDDGDEDEDDYYSDEEDDDA